MVELLLFLIVIGIDFNWIGSFLLLWSVSNFIQDFTDAVNQILWDSVTPIFWDSVTPVWGDVGEVWCVGCIGKATDRQQLLGQRCEDETDDVLFDFVADVHVSFDVNVDNVSDIVVRDLRGTCSHGGNKCQY